jgi:hypothetical protein
LRTMSSGGTWVRKCTQRSIHETVWDVRLHFPWRMMRMMVLVMN